MPSSFLSRSVFPALISIALSACAPNAKTIPNPHLPTEIVHGSLVKPADEIAKSTVALLLEQSEGQALCTATILDSETVLTAAHCVEGDLKKIEIVFSTHVRGAKAE